MVESRHRTGLGLLENFDAQFFRRSSRIQGFGRAIDFPPCGNGFTRHRIDRQTAIVDNVGKMFGTEGSGFAIDIDDKVASRIEIDMALGEFFVNRGDASEALSHGTIEGSLWF